MNRLDSVNRAIKLSRNATKGENKVSFVPNREQNEQAYSDGFVVPCTASWEFITPDMARQMLATGNAQNRGLSEKDALRFKGVLERHEFMYDCSDAVSLADEDDSVVNGQHRLTAIMNADVKGVWILVVRGVRRETVAILDQGRGRKFSQTLGIAGYPEPLVLQSAFKWMYRMQRGYEKSEPAEYRATQQQLFDLLADHPHIKDSIGFATPVYAEYRPILGKGELTAYHYAMSSVDSDMAIRFYGELVGNETETSEPVNVLREALLQELTYRQKHFNAHQAATWEPYVWLVRAWEAYAAGEHLTKQNMKRFTKAGPEADEFPRVSDVLWLGTVPDREPVEV